MLSTVRQALRRRRTGATLMLAVSCLISAAVPSGAVEPPVPSTGPAEIAAALASKDPAKMRAAVGSVGATMSTNAAKKVVDAGALSGPKPASAAVAADPRPAKVQSGPVTGSNGLSRMAPAAFSSTHWTPSFGILGQDVSDFQGTVNWSGQWNQGSRFAYTKATEGAYYTNPSFSSQYGGAAQQGMIRGAYHFANPGWSSGADQAKYFVSNGGGWNPDGITLPPVLDIEYNPYKNSTNPPGDDCYSMAGAPMVQWIQDFGNTMLQLTGRYPVIYTTTDWWAKCTGNSAGFGGYPLWIAAYPSSPSDSPGTLPASWQQYSMWQFSSEGPLVGDSDVWNGDATGLQRFATYGDTAPSSVIGTSSAQNSPTLGQMQGGIACGLRNSGCYQMFQGGAVIWSSASGAQMSQYGPIRNTWGAGGFENGRLAYPTSNGQSCGLTQAGCYQMFQGGAVIWSPSTGANSSFYGGIRNAWGAQGFESGRQGYPTMNGESCSLVNSGCYQMFQGGAVVWSPAAGAWNSYYGGIRTAWGRGGFENGRLGYPTNNESCQLVNGGCYQLFQGGAIIWSNATGGQQSPYGAIRNYWMSTGAERGPLGYPTSDEICRSTDSCYQTFQNGTLNWTPTAGVWVS